MMSLYEAGQLNLEILKSAEEQKIDVGILAHGQFHWCKVNSVTWDDMEDVCSLKVLDDSRATPWRLPVESITTVRVRNPNEDIL